MSRVCLSPGKIGHFWSLLLFCFFFLTPLFVVSGYRPDGSLMCTLYDLPRIYLIFCSALMLLLSYFLCPLPTPGNALLTLSRWTAFTLLLLAAGMAFSLVPAQTKVNALFTFANFVAMGVLVYVFAGVLRGEAQRWAAVAGLMGALALVSVLGVFQYFGHDVPFLMPIHGPASTFGYRNPAAHFAALVLPFVGFAALVGWGKWRSGKNSGSFWFFLVSVLLFLLGLALLFMNYSRTAIVAFVLELVAGVFFLTLVRKGKPEAGFIRRNRSFFSFGLVGIGLFAALLLVFPESRARFNRSYEKFRQGGVAELLEFRYYHWLNTTAMIKDHPLLGVGVGNWCFVYPLYHRREAVDPLYNYQTQVRRAHNDYLQLAAECGIPTLLLFLVMWGRQFYLLRYPGREGEVDWRLPLLASLTAFSVIMFFSFPLQMAYSRMFCFFLIGFGEARAWPALSN